MGARKLPWTALAAVALLAAHVALVAAAIGRNYSTFDEPGYLQAGLSHWKTGTFTMYRVNPPLPRMLAVLPVLAAHPATDFAELETLRAKPGARPEFLMAERFVRANGARYFELLVIARWAGVIWSILGALVAFAWARDRFGPSGGLAALGLWCFEPNVVAHASLLTPDVPCAAAALAAAYTFQRYLRVPSLARACAAGAVLGIAELTKFSLLLFYPVFLALFLHAAWRSARQGRSRGWRRGLGEASAIVAVSLAVIHAGYGFQGTLPRLGDVAFVSETFSGSPPSASRDLTHALAGNRFAGSWLGALRVPVPEEMIRGIDVQRRDFELELPSYLGGQWRSGGFWYYYLYALAVKVPLGVWALVVCASVAAVRRRASARASATGGGAPDGAGLALLVPPIALLVFVSSQTGFSHHMRYVLPIFPFFFVHAARLARLAAPVVAHTALCSIAIAPHPLSYFNEIAGGPEAGSKHLVDSNVDWGQDLLELKAWTERHPEAFPLRVAYFNLVPPEAEGLVYETPPVGPRACSPDTAEWSAAIGPLPGYYAVSVSYLRGARYPLPDGRWGRRKITRGDFDYLEAFTPIGYAGHSIALFHVTLEQANAERRRLELPPLGGKAALAVGGSGALRDGP